jgi:integrase
MCTGARQLIEGARYLEDGKLVVFKRNQIYYARVKLGTNKYVWRSLSTSNLEEAVSKARKIYYRLQALEEQGLPTTAKSFRVVIDPYVAFREKDCAQGRTKPAMLRQIMRVVKFWKEHAGPKAVHMIGDVELRGYVDWRRDYYANKYVNVGLPLPCNAKLNPTDKTLQWEIMLGKQILKWAHSSGLRGSKPLPTYSFTPKLKRVRPPFELEEYRVLWRALWKRVRFCPNENWRESRELLRDYVLILANSGLRVGEANSLRIRNVIPFKDSEGRDNFRLVVSGKTGERDVIPRATAAKFIMRVLARRAGASPDDLLFVMSDGAPVLTLIDQFNAALSEAGITHNSQGNKFTLYSLCHFYAVMALRKGVAVFAVARNMGTSVQMIQS